MAWPLSVGWTWQAFYATTGLVPLFNAWLVKRWVPESPTFLQYQAIRFSDPICTLIEFGFWNQNDQELFKDCNETANRI